MVAIDSKSFNIHADLPLKRPRLGAALSFVAMVIFAAPSTAQLPSWYKVYLAIAGTTSALCGVRFLHELKDLEPLRLVQGEARLELLSQKAAVQATIFTEDGEIKPQEMPVKSDWEQNEATNESLQLFDWGRFNTERDDFPHVAIAGKTGGGKSYLAEFLATLFEGYTIAVSPHWKKGDFTSADLVVGWGRNTGESAQFEHSFADIMTGQFNVSVGGFMYALLQEMDRRYQLDPVTQEYMGANDPEIVVILDEFNLYANLEGLPIITKQLLREARKVRIRLIPLVQGTEVKAMGVEGEGQLREQLTFIRVKNKAKEFADQEFSKHCRDEKAGYWDMVKNFISASRYSCFVEDFPAQIPDLTEWKKLQPPLANLAGFNTQNPNTASTVVNVATNDEGDHAGESCPHCGSYSIKWLSRNANRKQCKKCDGTWTIKQ